MSPAVMHRILREYFVPSIKKRQPPKVGGGVEVVKLKKDESLECSGIFASLSGALA